MIRKLQWTLGLCLIAPGMTTRADGPDAGWTPLAEATWSTQKTGRPTVVVATSSRSPESLALRRDLLGIAEARSLAGTIHFAEMPESRYAVQLRALRVDGFPTVIVYRRGSKGLEVVDTLSRPKDAYVVTAWLGTLGLESAADRPDEGLVRAQHATPQRPNPTPQAPPQPPPYQPPYQPPYVPQYAPQPQYAPIVQTPAAAPMVLSQPGPTFMVQQQAPTIMLAPPSAPNIVVMQAPSQAPSVSYAPQGPASAPAPNFFAPAPQPSQAPPAYAPQQPMMMVAQAPQPAQAPAVGQGPLLATAATMILTNPSLIDSMLGTIGEHFANKKNPRIKMVQAPAIAQAPTAPAGYAPAGYAPAVCYGPTGGQAYLAVPAGGYGGPPGYGPPPYAEPPGYGPSPQGYTPGPSYPAPAPPRKGGLFHR